MTTFSIRSDNFSSNVSFCSRDGVKGHSEENQRQFVETAFHERNWKALGELVSKGASVSEGLRLQIIQQVIHEDPLNGEQILMGIPLPIGSALQDSALNLAIRKNYLRVIEFYSNLSERSFSLERRAINAMTACRTGNLQAVKALITNHYLRPINYDHLIRRSVDNNNTEMALYFLSNYSFSTPEAYFKALEEAIKNNNSEIVNALLNKDIPISEEKRADFVLIAVLSNNLEIMQRLLPLKASLTQDDRGQLVIDACAKGATSIVKELLVHDHYLGAFQLCHEALGRISKEDRGKALSKAALRGDLEITRALLGSVSPEFLLTQIDLIKSAFDLATRCHHQEVAEYLKRFIPDKA